MIIVAAHKAELAPFASRLGFKKKTIDDVSVYQGVEHIGFLCGSGRRSVRLALSRFLAAFPQAIDETWLNIGIAGQRSASSTVGNLVWVKDVSSEQGDASFMLRLPANIHLSQQVSVKTVSQPIALDQTDLPDSMVVDMELAHIAEFLTTLSAHKATGLQLISAKLISDNRAVDIPKITPESARSLIFLRADEILKIFK